MSDFEPSIDRVQESEVDFSLLEGQLENVLRYIPEEQRRMFCMYHGVLGNTRLTQEELSTAFGVPQSVINDNIRGTTKRVREILKGIYNIDR